MIKNQAHFSKSRETGEIHLNTDFNPACQNCYYFNMNQYKKLLKYGNFFLNEAFKIWYEFYSWKTSQFGSATFPVLSNPMWLLATTHDSEDLFFVRRLKGGGGLLTHESLRGWRPVLAQSRKNRSHVQAAIPASTCLVRGEGQCLSNTCHIFPQRGIGTAPGHSPSDLSRSWRPKQVTVFINRSISLPLIQAPVLLWWWDCGRGRETGLFFVKNKDLHNLLSADPVTC